MAPEDSGATVRMIDVYAEMVKMSANLAVISKQLEAIPDHEARIRALERWRYALPTTIILAAGSAIPGVLALVRH